VAGQGKRLRIAAATDAVCWVIYCPARRVAAAVGVRVIDRILRGVGGEKIWSIHKISRSWQGQV